MRIGYVVKRFPRYSETFVVTEVLAHEAAGWHVEIFSLRPPNDTHFQDLLARVRAPVRYLPSEGTRPTDFWAALQEAGRLLPGAWPALGSARGTPAGEVHQALLLALEVRRRGIEHLHAHFATVAAGVARLAARLAEVPFSFTAHAKDIFHETVRPDDLRAKLEEAAAVITVSDFNLAHLRATFGAAAARVRRIYNGLELERFPYADPRVRPRRVVAVGRMVEKKGFEVLLEAAALLSARGADFTVDLIGGGELEERLRRRIDELGVGRRVRLVGLRPQAEIARAVSEAAVLAAPCVVGRDGNRDGLPTTLLEAMALGTPCVSTDVTGIPEVVRDGETGLLVPQNDAAALAAGLERLLDDPSLRVTLAGRARRRIEEDFDARRNSARMRQILLEAHTGRPEAALAAAKAG
ncbi:MAG TPA: glycosyltransferase [Vicinamibacteria bacterium]|jgi:glycosyltransferase involved in cell wall biosynthesis